jgi:hypothetical protein
MRVAWHWLEKDGPYSLRVSATAHWARRLGILCDVATRWLASVSLPVASRGSLSVVVSSYDMDDIL